MPELHDPTVEWLAGDQQITRADAARRFAWQMRAEQLTDRAVETLGNRFGGMWIDEEDGGRIKVGVFDASQRDRIWVNAEGFRGAADIVDVPRSLDQLEDAADRLWSQAYTLNQETVDSGSAWTLAVSVTPSARTVNLFVPPSEHRSDAQRALSTTPWRWWARRCGSRRMPHRQAKVRVRTVCLRTATRRYGQPSPLTTRTTALGRSRPAAAATTSCTCSRPATARGTGRTTGARAFRTTATTSSGPVHNCEAGRGPANNCRRGDGDYAILRVNNPSGWKQGRGWAFVRSSPNDDGVNGTSRNTSYTIRRASRLGSNWEGMPSARVGGTARAAAGCMTSATAIHPAAAIATAIWRPGPLLQRSWRQRRPDLCQPYWLRHPPWRCAWHLQ